MEPEALTVARAKSLKGLLEVNPLGLAKEKVTAAGGDGARDSPISGGTTSLFERLASGLLQVR